MWLVKLGNAHFVVSISRLNLWKYEGSVLYNESVLANHIFTNVAVVTSYTIKIWFSISKKVSAHWGPMMPVYVSQWASCQIREIAGAHAPGIPGTFSPPPRVSNPDMHHGTCVTHVPWCKPGSLTRVSFELGGGGKRSRHSRRMRNPQFYVSGKRPISPGEG